MRDYIYVIFQWLETGVSSFQTDTYLLLSVATLFVAISVVSLMKVQTETFEATLQ